MSLVVAHTGSRAMLNCVFGQQTLPTGFTLKLFVGPRNPAQTTDAILGTALDLAVGGGYADKALLKESAVPFLSADGVTHSVSWPRQTFAFTGPLTNTAIVIPPALNATIPPIIGYAVVDNANTLIFFELFPDFYPGAGQNLCVDVAFKMGNMASLGTIAGIVPIQQ